MKIVHRIKLEMITCNRVEVAHEDDKVGRWPGIIWSFLKWIDAMMTRSGSEMVKGMRSYGRSCRKRPIIFPNQCKFN